MKGINYPNLINLISFALGIALYAMLLAMTLSRPLPTARSEKFAPNAVLTATALLGLFWNLGELASYIWQDFFGRNVSPFLSAVSFSALGFLPAVVVHSNLADRVETERKGERLIYAAYFLSLSASLINFGEALFSGNIPSVFALRALTIGYLGILFLLFTFNLRQTLERKAVWITALAIFAASALHLSRAHTAQNSYSIIIEVTGHQASLPLVIAILLQNYRFAFADIFLKRALSLFLLVLTAILIYSAAAVPLLRLHERHGDTDMQTVAALILCWVATALIFPYLQKVSRYFVDKIILKRPDYEDVKREIALEVENLQEIELVLEAVAVKLRRTLLAQDALWREVKDEAAQGFHQINAEQTRFVLPLQEKPLYELILKDFAGGRRLLSDDVKLLQDTALLTARRIDGLRVVQERFAVEMREQKIAKLAGEAELRALRAQINPHFLFNALTAIGYLIQTAPPRAFETLMQLTKLLRVVLRSTGEFTTLGDELNLIENYLQIEKARFEERLHIEIDAAPELRRFSIPSLILQPLVENAVKHAVSINKNGGRLCVRAFLKNNLLHLQVTDDGAGSDMPHTLEDFSGGVGLANIRARLNAHYGTRAALKLAPENDGTTAVITIPLEKMSVRLEKAEL